jgi:GT2 family glycosyltransferase
MLNPKTGKKWRVYMGVPSTGGINDFLPYMVREWEKRYSDDIEFVWPDVLCQRIFHDAARQGIGEDFLKTDCDILWFIDSDVVPPKHAPDLVSMHGDKWLCAGAPYPIFMAQPGEMFRQVVITVYKGVSKEKKALAPAAQIPFEGTDWVDGLATGCMMIKREVFDRLEQPYFEFKYDPITRQPIEGEDLGFCLKMHKLGIQFFTDYSMVCKHYKNNIDLLEINNYCMEYARKAVDAYHQQTKKTVEAHIKSMPQKPREAALKKWAISETQVFPK